MSDLRFGVSDGLLHSQYWKVAAAARRPELVIAGSQSGRFLHVTVHENEAFWHIEVTLPEGVIQRPWQPPLETLPGVRRLIRLLIPIEAVRYPAPKRAERVHWFQAPPDQRSWAEFMVLHCRQGRPRILSAIVVGGVELADGSEALVLARHSPAEPGPMTIPTSKREEARRALSQPGKAVLLHRTEPDGCLWFLHLQSSRSDLPQS